MSFAERHLGFILSAGRTGTVFLARRLAERFPDVCCLHEPSPARLELLLGNFRNRTGLGGGLLRRVFLSARENRCGRLDAGRKYIEINPMLCPLADLIAELPRPLRVVHLVRDPRTWTASILAFKASGLRRHVIDYVPFGTPYPSPRPPGWSRLGRPERALWRWRWCNEQIEDLAPQCDRYALVRYEDLFSPDPGIRKSALRQLLDVLEIACDDDLEWFDVERRVNAAPKARSEEWVLDEARVVSICDPLLGRFGYS